MQAAQCSQDIMKIDISNCAGSPWEAAWVSSNSFIKTHGSESRGQEEAGCMQQTSEFFTCSTAVKFVYTLNKQPLKLSLSYL